MYLEEQRTPGDRRWRKNERSSGDARHATGKRISGYDDVVLELKNSLVLTTQDQIAFHSEPGHGSSLVSHSVFSDTSPYLYLWDLIVIYKSTHHIEYPYNSWDFSMERMIRLFEIEKLQETQLHTIRIVGNCVSDMENPGIGIQIETQRLAFRVENVFYFISIQRTFLFYR